MYEPIRMDRQTLGEIEEEWTGTSRLSGTVQDAQSYLHTVTTCTIHLGTKWHQVRELFAVAIARDAWPAIVTASRLKQKARIEQLSPFWL